MVSSGNMIEAPAPAPDVAPAPRKPVTRDRGLDGLRGLAVLMIFVFHYGGGMQGENLPVQILGYITQVGWTGVILFFALSGFLITGSLWDSIDEDDLLLNFYMRRALRILPLYLLAVVAGLIASAYFDPKYFTWQTFLIYGLFVQNLPFLSGFVQAHPSYLPMYHFWSLAVEEQFYIIWPLMLVSVDERRTARRYAAGVFAVSVVFCLVVWGLPQMLAAVYSGWFNDFFLTHCGALAVGSYVALALRSKSRSGRVGKPRIFLQRWARHAFWGGIAIYLLVSWFNRSLLSNFPMEYMLGIPALGISAACLIPIVLRFGIVRSVLSVGPLAGLGRISYGFYVFHILLQPLFFVITLNLTHTWHGNVYQTVRFFVAFAITLPVAWLSFRFFELPILRLKRKFPMRKAVPEL